jgi:DNA/RNA endonuclease G (NUC1)
MNWKSLAPADWLVRELLSYLLLVLLIWLLLTALATAKEPGETAAPSKKLLAKFAPYGFPTAIRGAAPSVQFNGAIAFEYDARSGNPAWTMEVLEPGTVGGGADHAERKDSFCSDDRVLKPWRTTTGDYLRSGWAKGHAGASGNYNDQALQDESYKLTNIFPQNSDLNENFWARAVEDRGVRRRVRDEGLTAVVMTVPLYPNPRGGKVTIDTIGEHDVWVPDRVAKSVLFVRDRKCEFPLTWIVANKPIPHDAPSRTYRVSVRALELEARREFFPALDPEEAARLKTAEPRGF